MSGQNTPILANDWNTIQATIAKVLGAPDATTVDLGYNSAGSITSSQVAQDSKIYKEEWNTLRADVNIAYTHQTGADSALGTKSGTDIVYASDFTLIASGVSTANTNRLTLGSSQATYQAGPNFSEVATWGSRSYIDGTITWADNAAFRGFWNGGGYVTFNASRTGGAVNDQNTGWSNLLTNMGTIKLSARSMVQTGQSWDGTFYNDATLGVYGSGIGTGVQVFKVNDQDTNYTANYYNIAIAFDDADKFAAKIMYFTVECVDSHAAGGTAILGPDAVDGTLAMNCGVYYPFSNSASMTTRASGQT